MLKLLQKNWNKNAFKFHCLELRKYSKILKKKIEKYGKKWHFILFL